MRQLSNADSWLPPPLRPPVERLRHCSLSPLSPLREGPGGGGSDAPIALSEALYIALTEGRPFPKLPSRRGPLQHPYRGNSFSETEFEGGTGRNMSYQGKKNIPKITVSKRSSSSLDLGTLITAAADLCIRGDGS